ncbi:DUF2783 domain-containing protein [Aestuariicoccus sp. MJ-SS9]|uniref:DUF2783 domain-containing protein n=1 Tax=Aestuariicoccus sp. MJ-SS9 TaxID=3079855 RepID=UPI00290C0E10|nr:DUF2783 domain-containing protein [Aestuariicoccus sp. MJ-SS9]MDU8910220.1 DUF2783 domain-containing protein [Aestuariicoccus sp. MJ-SS9]
MTDQTDRLGARGDDVYAALMAAHEGLTEAESHSLNARLVLMLANRVGDADAVIALIRDAADMTGKDA